MIRQKPRVLFVSHEATRTGAPRVLLELVGWLKDNTDLELRVLLLDGGPLEDAFAELAPTTVLPRPPTESTPILRTLVSQSRVVLRSARSALRAWRRIRVRPADLIYLNSTPSVRQLRILPVGHAPVIAHIHELATGIRTAIPGPVEAPDMDAFLELMRRVDRYIAVGPRVADVLTTDYGVDPTRITVCHDFVNAAAVDLSVAQTRDLRIRERLGIPDHAKVVMGMGMSSWRKGSDLFVQLAQRLRSSLNGAIHFVWVGDFSDPHIRWLVEGDIKALGLGSRVHFIGQTEAPYDYLRAADVFVLTSREDPFPLVCLEASLVGVPIVAFDAGGIPELLADGAGHVVPYLDVDEMASRVTALLADHENGRRIATVAADRVREKYNVTVQAPRIAAEIEALLQSTSRR